MRTDPGFPADPTQPTRPSWRIVFDAATLATQRVKTQRVGQRQATVIIDNEDADVAYAAAVDAATDAEPDARLQLAYPSVYAVENTLAPNHQFLSISDPDFLGILRVGDTLRIDDEDLGVAELRPGQGIRLSRPLNGTALAEHPAGTPIVRWVTQFKGVVVAPVYARGQVTVTLRVVPVSYYPTKKTEAPEYNHLPVPDALVTGTDSNVRVPNPRAPVAPPDSRVPRPVA